MKRFLAALFLAAGMLASGPAHGQACPDQTLACTNTNGVCSLFQFCDTVTGCCLNPDMTILPDLGAPPPDMMDPCYGLTCIRCFCSGGPRANPFDCGCCHNTSGPGC